MTPVAEEKTMKTAPSKGGVKVTDKALAKVRTAIVKEGISPEQGGLAWACRVAGARG